MMKGLPCSYNSIDRIKCATSSGAQEAERRIACSKGNHLKRFSFVLLFILFFAVIGPVSCTDDEGDRESTDGIGDDDDSVMDDDDAAQPDDDDAPLPDRNDPLEIVTLFEQGEGGYHFRIPAIVQTPGGALLAFAEGRIGSASDHPDAVHLVSKRSLDRGETWGELRIIGAVEGDYVKNPAPVVDRQTGRVLLLFQRYDQHVTETAIRAGWVSRTPEVWMMGSDDDGETWGPMVELTAQVKLENWLWYATGPCHGIQLTRTGHAGRLVVPANHSRRPESPAHLAFTNSLLGAHLIYSDDGGFTGQIGGTDTQGAAGINPSETTVVEKTDGRLYVNTRNQHGWGPNRAVALGLDGGATFDGPLTGDAQLIAPVVQGAVSRYSAVDEGHQRNLLLFTAPYDNRERKDMMIWTSPDEGVSWNPSKVLHAGPAAYSDIVVTEDRWIGVLFEAGTDELYERIDFARFGVGWLLASSTQ